MYQERLSIFRLLIPQILSAFLVLTAFTAPAQTCSGNLGDPVVNITFGQDGVTNTGYTPTNAYTYTSSQCPNDGFYTITTSTANCFGSTWHTVTQDHTGNGAFMIINASYDPGDFVRTQVSELCPNTTYEFAAWVMNLVNVDIIDPNITFSVETLSGVVIAKYTTGDIPETPGPEWKKYGFFFTTPPNNPEIILRMTNNAPGGSGNDIAIDDITFSPCIGTVVTATVIGNSLINICQDDLGARSLNATVSAGFVQPVYNWQLSEDMGDVWQDIPGATSLNYQRNPTGTGEYWYRITARDQSSVDLMHCRITSAPVKIKVIANPTVDAGGDKLVVKGQGVTLEGVITNSSSTSVYWVPPDFLSDSRKAITEAYPDKDIKYILYAETPEGCKGQDELFVKVLPYLYVPSAFTPNNDGLNDRWRIPHLVPGPGTVVQVFNRFGKRVYSANGVAVNWDGTFNGVPQSAGTYVYFISNGSKKSNVIKGVLTLIR
jgi:gliding motility-associated-like protein